MKTITISRLWELIENITKQADADFNDMVEKNPDNETFISELKAFRNGKQLSLTTLMQKVSAELRL